MKLVLTVGGKGVRLQPLTYDIPKPMLKMAGKPVLEYAIEWAKKYGINEIIVCAGYLHQHIQDYFGDGSKFGISIKYSVEKVPLDTGGPLRLAKDLIGDDDFIMLHGDILCKVDANKLMDFHKKNNALCTLVVHKSSHPHDSDLVEYDNEGKVIKFWRKPHTETPPTDVGNAGLHVFSSKVLDFIPEGKYSLEKELIPKLLKNKENVYAYDTEEFLKDMGTHERMQKLGGLIEEKGWWNW
tara:strand:+ start:1063 stop:1782 length:720 start_codon:yes stop_codon:yes gene_type:complete